MERTCSLLSGPNFYPARTQTKNDNVDETGGELAGTFPSKVGPLDAALLSEIDALLN